jgi:small-conductance mechanosensitive channel
VGDDQQHYREFLTRSLATISFWADGEILPENLKGRVTKINLMFTTLREDSGNELQVPNNFFFQKMFRVGDQPGDSNEKTATQRRP